MRPNRLRELLRAGKPSLGTHIHTMLPSVVELAGHSGVFDYVELLGEYAPYDQFTLENLARAVGLFYPMTSMIKLDQQPRIYLAIKALNAGIQNVLFPDVRSVADAEECVRAVRAETPMTGGRHGVALSRDVGYLLEVGTPAYVQAMQDAVVALMIEKKEAVENLEAILSVPGVDMVQFGPADYSMSIGVPGQRNHPAVLEAERHVIETALKRGIQPRAEFPDPKAAERYLEMGVRHFCMGTDISVLFQWFREVGGPMRAALSEY